MNEKDEIEISLGDIFGAFKKNLIFIIIITMLCSFMAFFYTKLFITKTYTVSISLYVETTNDSAEVYSGSANDLNSYNYAQKLVATYIRMLNTKTFYAEVSEELNGKYTAGGLYNMIVFSGDDETEIFDASVTSVSPVEAKKIADAVAEIAPKTIQRLNSNARLKIVDYAEIPSKPSSPNTTKNTLVGFVAGLLLSLAISLLRSFLDKKIKYTADMTKLNDIPILAAIPDFEGYEELLEESPVTV